jgi:hypothetical protein
MCFSASASFIVSGVLGILGVISIGEVKKPRLYFLAAMPFIFSIQQAAEGFVWVYQAQIAAMIYLFFALIIWPTFIPVGLFLVERKSKARNYLLFFSIAGVSLSLYYLVIMIMFTPEFSLEGCHIVYTIYPLSASVFVRSAVYGACTLLPFFISTVAYMEIIGLLGALACLVSYLFFTLYFISVWCFFAALISAVIVAIVRKN